MITTQHLSRAFGDRLAVNDVTFTVAPGTIFGLLGPNGAGKTTLIKVLTGQINPTHGTATVAGYDVLHQRDPLKREIGVVAEVPTLYERLSAWDNLAFACRLYSLPFTRAEAVLDLVRLRDRAADPISRYSTGMTQRLLIARALLHEPRVLFLDEPTRGLDPVSAHEVRTAIATLRDAGMTVLLTTHIMEEAEQWCDDLAFLVNGRIVAHDTPARLKATYGQPYWQVTVGEGHHPHTLAQHDPAHRAQLAAWIADGSLRTIHSADAALADIFRHLTTTQGTEGTEGMERVQGTRSEAMSTLLDR